MYYYTESGELYHFGRKGMKWYQNIYTKHKQKQTAKRRAEALKKARETKAANAKAAAERQRLVDSGKISAKKMTTEELKSRIERINLEKQYKEAIKSNRELDKGKRFIEKFLTATIDKVAENSAADVVAQSLKVLTTRGANSMFGKEEVFTNNKKKG